MSVRKADLRIKADLGIARPRKVSGRRADFPRGPCGLLPCGAAEPTFLIGGPRPRHLEVSQRSVPVIVFGRRTKALHQNVISDVGCAITRYTDRMRSTVFRVLAWGLLLAIFVFTDAPIMFRPETHLPPNVERFAALCVVGAAFALAYPRRLPLVFCLLFCAIGIFELLQLIPSSRHAHIEDVFFKDAGALVGISIVYVIGKIGGGDRSKAPIQTDRMKATVERET
jgi:hypothetical protein